MKQNKISILLFITIFTALAINLSGTNTKKTTPKFKINSYVPDKTDPLWKYIDSLTVIDTHEHISSEAELLGLEVDFFDMLIPYIVDNLESAGITSNEMALMKNKKAAFKSRWEVFNKYYADIQNTTYILALRRALNEQYQFKDFSLAECERLTALFKSDFATKGFMQKFMDRNKIESMLTFRSCSLAEIRRPYGDNKIQLVPTVNEFCVLDASTLPKISEMAEMPVKNIDDLLAAIDKMFQFYAANGIKNIKFNSAYNREINYKRRTRDEAEKSFKKVMDTPFDYSNVVPNKYYVYALKDYHIPLDDYLAVHMIEQADKYQMNVIFHVGPFAWNYNSITTSHTSSLEWVIKSFPNINFVILHAGYPFFDEAMLLAKYYPNVYINMTWDHIIEREKIITAMKSYIEMLPISKIHGFGGDYLYPQQILGNLVYTKENMYKTFTDLINTGILTKDQAKKIAYDWLYANPKAFYYK